MPSIRGVGARANRFGDALRGFARPWEIAVFLCLPLALLSVVFFADLRWSNSLGDWEIFRAAAISAVHGRSPYAAAVPASLTHNDAFVYPPVTAFFLAPLALLPAELGRVLVLVLAAACIPLALRLLGVRDWRCYGLALLTAPVVDTVSLGALSSLLLLGIAVAWRYRDRPPAAAVAVSVTAVAKLFVWPLWVWLLATRRLLAALESAILGLLLVVGGWAAISFAGLRSYPQVLRLLSRIEAAESYSLAGLLRLTGPGATLLTVVLAALVVAAVFLAARSPDGDRRAISVAIAGALLVTPVLWLHYFVLLFVPIALYRPRLSGLWLVPLGFWITPLGHSDGITWHTAFALLLATAIIARTLGARTAPSPVQAAPASPAPAS
jgi:Glycosyltransferase family 87